MNEHSYYRDSYDEPCYEYDSPTPYFAESSDEYCRFSGRDDYTGSSFDDLSVNALILS